MLDHLPLDEKWNVYTHGFGAVMSLLGSVLLFNHLNEVDTTITLALLIYGFSMVFLFSASAIYHGVLPRQQAFWQKIDHIGIYFLISNYFRSLFQSCENKKITLSVSQSYASIWSYFKFFRHDLIIGILGSFFFSALSILKYCVFH